MIVPLHLRPGPVIDLACKSGTAHSQFRFLQPALQLVRTSLELLYTRGCFNSDFKDTTVLAQ